MESLTLPHLPSHPLHLALFLNVANAPFLRQQLLQGNPDFEYALIDATTIISRTHLLAACFRAVADATQHRLRSRNVHSEIVFALGVNNNIAESFRRHGISDSTTALIAVKVAPEDAARTEAHLRGSVEGEMVACSDEALAKLTDRARARKVYKAESEAGVLGAMALRGS